LTDVGEYSEELSPNIRRNQQQDAHQSDTGIVSTIAKHGAMTLFIRAQRFDTVLSGTAL
jgi:hypothetical protein